jgi:hypothetical protein
MSDQKTSDTRHSENPQREERDITQDRPSHMNQGNETFYPDQQKKREPSSESSKSDKSGQEERSHKVS